MSGSKNYYFTKFIKEYNNDNTSLTPKLATNNVPVIHNLEPYDPDIHNYILENIIMKSGDTLNTEISNVGILGEYHESSDTRSVSGWYIKIRNTHNQEYTYAYNRKMCFLDDAKNWTGLTDIETFRLKAGETKIVEISANGFATSIAISYTSGSTRYIKYADNIFGDYEVYKMKTYSSTTSYRSYTENGMKVSIAGKNDGTWLIELTNNTGSGRTFYYNRKMCFDGDAQNWSGLSDVSTIYLSSGETTWAPLEISENGTATAIAISYNVGIERHIFYANNLNVSGTMTSYSNSKPTTYTQHGMKVCIVSKSGSTWKIQLTNNTGSTRTFEYNKKMCFDGDAQNWNGLADVSSITLSNGASTQLSISENGFATAITISYLIDDTRYIFWANNLNATTGTMSSYSSVLIPDIPPTECVAEGTLITLADGTQKAVEDLTGDELLLVWDMETGTYGAAPIMFVDSDLIGHYEVIKLSFSDGTTVEVISEHGFWDVDLNEYVYLDENADDYIGHKFVKQNGEGYTEVTLTDVEISVEVTRAYSPVTYGHLCYYVNGMLSMPGGISGLFNIFDIDAETMSIDEEAYAADIAEYGVYTYEEFSETFPVSEEVFEAFNGKYLKVAIGKGQLTEERIGELIERYSEFF